MIIICKNEYCPKDSTMPINDLAAPRWPSSGEPTTTENYASTARKNATARA